MSLCGCPGSLVEQFSRFQHGVHDYGEFASHRDGGAFEADPLPQFEPPVSQRALRRTAGQNDRRRFVKKTAHLVITPSGDVAVVSRPAQIDISAS